MSKLDDIFRQHLDRIRKELDFYIDLHLLIAEHKTSDPVREYSTGQKKKDGVLEKFLNCMNLNDESDEQFDSDYLDEQDKCISAPSSGHEEKKSSCLEKNKREAPHAPANLAASVPIDPAKTPEFLRKGRDRKELDRVLDQKEESFSEMLIRIIDEKGLKDSDVYKRANIDRRLFSKIRSDQDYVPSRKTAISFCMALQLELEEAKKLLATAGYTLSASSRFDLIIMYLIENCEYNVHFANIVLNDYGEGTLSR